MGWGGWYAERDGMEVGEVVGIGIYVMEGRRDSGVF